MSAKPETDLSRRIRDSLNGLGLCEVWRQQSGVVRVRRGMLHLAPKRSSDLVGFLLDGTGRILALEVKLPNEKPTKEQIESLARVEAAGGVSGVVRSTDEAVELVMRARRVA